MADERERSPVEENELEEQNGELLPDREEMAVLNPDPLDPVAGTLPIEPRDDT